MANARLASGEWVYRISHAIIFGMLSNWARPRLRRQGVRHTAWVFGLLQNGRVDVAFVESCCDARPLVIWSFTLIRRLISLKTSLTPWSIRRSGSWSRSKAFN